MLKAIIFDCDGVIADTEPLHLQAFTKILQEEGIELTEKAYFDEYLALDDRGCFTKAYSSIRGETLSTEQLAALIHRKALCIEPLMQAHLKLFAGVADFIKQAASKYPIAIASGALRNEIDMILQYGEITDYFRVIVSAEDVANSKPHPESFLKALTLLQQVSGYPMQNRECLVIEDSIHGVNAAKSAQMCCLAVTNSYAKESLSAADLIVESLLDVSLKTLESLFES